MKPFCRSCEVLKRLVKPDHGVQAGMRPALTLEYCASCHVGAHRRLIVIDDGRWHLTPYWTLPRIIIRQYFLAPSSVAIEIKLQNICHVERKSLEKYQISKREVKYFWSVFNALSDFSDRYTKIIISSPNSNFRSLSICLSRPRNLKYKRCSTVSLFSLRIGASVRLSERKIW